jgi:hypothetical protein
VGHAAWTRRRIRRQAAAVVAAVGRAAVGDAVRAGNPRAGVCLTDDEDATPIPWSEARARLIEGRSYWFATARADGAPHVRPVLAVWVDGALHTTSSPQATKGRNLTADGRCSLSLSTDGMDLVYEGVATRVGAAAPLERIAAAYRDKYGWPVVVRGTAFHAPYGAPTAGDPPYEAYVVAPIKVFALGTDDDLAPRSTRFTF